MLSVCVCVCVPWSHPAVCYKSYTQDQITAALATVKSELAARGGLPLVGLINNAGVTGKADPVRCDAMRCNVIWPYKREGSSPLTD